MHAVVIFCIFATMLISVLVLFYIKFSKTSKNTIQYFSNNETIYCIMITGKDNDRELYSLLAITNFLNQTYDNKVLIIINHGSFALNSDDSNIKIYNITKTPDVTLGHLRNIALDKFVPVDGLWITWDDDDYRSNTFLQTLYDYMITSRVDAVSFNTRYEFNIHTMFLWKTVLKEGFVFKLMRNNKHIRYLLKDTMEDINLLQDLKRNNIRYKVIDNISDYSIVYIRLIHASNTSLYVNKQKDKVMPSCKESNYQELPVSKNECLCILKIIVSYYKMDNLYMYSTYIAQSNLDVVNNTINNLNNRVNDYIFNNFLQGNSHCHPSLVYNDRFTKSTTNSCAYKE